MTSLLRLFCRHRHVAIVVALLVVGCEGPPGAERLAARDRFVAKMGIRIESLDCDPTVSEIGPPWECSAVTATGAPAKFACSEQQCWWRTGR